MTVLVGARDEERGREDERTLREAGIDARFVQLKAARPGRATQLPSARRTRPTRHEP
jgi:hypothetical protein